MSIEYKKSLKLIQKDIIQKNKILIKIKRVHKHIADLSISEILKYFNVTSIFDLEEFSNIKIDYNDTIDRDNRVSYGCFCTDRDNNPKELYLSQKDAILEALRVSTENNIKINIYPCRYSYGWHLTKS